MVTIGGELARINTIIVNVTAGKIQYIGSELFIEHYLKKLLNRSTKNS